MPGITNPRDARIAVAAAPKIDTSFPVPVFGNSCCLVATVVPVATFGFAFPGSAVSAGELGVAGLVASPGLAGCAGLFGVSSHGLAGCTGLFGVKFLFLSISLTSL